MQLDELPFDHRPGYDALASRPVAIPIMGEPTGIAAGLGQVPMPRPTLTDIKAQTVRMADVMVFGPLMLYAGLGRQTPTWLKLGMVIIGAGTIIYNLANYFQIEKETSGLGQMQWGPPPQIRTPVADTRRPIQLVRQLQTHDLLR